MRKNMTPYYLMVVPALLLFFAFHTFPVLMGIFYSFTNWDGLSKTYQMVGLKNYISVFQDPVVYRAYWFTFKFAVLTTIIVNVISLAVALGLNSRIKLKNMFRAVYFLPNILSLLIVGYIFNYIFSNMLPDIFAKMHMDSLAFNILGSREWAWVGILIVTVWQATAFNIILYLAGLQTIPADLYEASSLDGAGKWKEFKHITFPLIAPFFTINMVLAMKNFLMVFDQIVALTAGGPAQSTTSISLLIFSDGFQGGSFAYQSANAVIYFVVIVIISALQLRFLQRREMSLQ
ncbi:carbohydrate ABC transporter permease [Paenibacillus ehimensis]|uniref:Sugar ABC transporter permease n=1 Tax=Paenibacillus ehimensis TaxID=79264 RepID=A0ABT8VIR1_9BACL|nr:sugar ABC transporter permease [Paenibacillus ehimensis]MDO3680875.1 sugar ABC transporter permease [Paenibacillus ehimensis]MEC0211954.1 sugar ABC transporter permease [Paenibacillus ehimensis]